MMRHWPSGVNSKERGVREGSSALSARLAFNVFLFLLSDSRPRTLYESLRLSSGRNEGARDIRRTGKAKSKKKKKKKAIDMRVVESQKNSKRRGGRFLIRRDGLPPLSLSLLLFSASTSRRRPHSAWRMVVHIARGIQVSHITRPWTRGPD